MPQSIHHTLVRIFTVAVLLGSISFSPTATGKAQAATSPTGRQPKLYWTSERQAVWNRMRDENHPYWQLVKLYADRSLTCSRRSGDIGQWATLAYQFTGEKKYADTAWTMLTTPPINYPCAKFGSKVSHLDPSFRPDDGRNFTREAFIDFVWMYDWLYPGLTEEQRTTFHVQLNQWSDWVRSAVLVDGKSWGTRLTDSDETTGHFFGLAFTELATSPENAKASGLLMSTFKGLSGDSPVGGLDATAANLDSSMRNAIKRYAELAKGGQWVESTEYNMGTLRILYSGIDGTTTATGTNHFPEYNELRKEFALSLIREVTPDLNDAYQWGDNQEPRSLHLGGRMTIMGLLAGLTQNDPEVSPYVQKLTLELMDKNGLGHKAIGQPSGAEPPPPFFIFFNPYAPSADWRTKFSNGELATGQGVMFYHNGWQINDTMLGIHFPRAGSVDHGVRYQGSWQLYRKGEWAITHPIAYQHHSGEFANAMLIGGLSAAYEGKGIAAQEFGANDDYVYVVGTTGGQYYRQPYFNPPPTFLHEWTRSFLYLPSNNKSSDTVVMYDRTHAENPKSLPLLYRYQAAERDAMNASSANKQWILHMPVEPTKKDNQLSWKTTGGQNVTATTLLPAQYDQVIHDEKVLFAQYRSGFLDSEKRFQARIIPKSEQDWDTFLHVVQVSDEANGYTNSTVKSSLNEAEGAFIQRPGQNDTLVMFSAKQSPKVPSQPYGDKLQQIAASRVLGTGYTTTITSVANTTDIFFADLDRTKKWSLTDNSKVVDLAISDQGLARASISGTGQHTLVLSDSAPVISEPEPHVKTTITLSKAVDKATAKDGDTLTYEITYKNTGAKKATNTIVQDAVPQGTIYVADSANATQGCYHAASDTVKWNLGDIPANQGGKVIFTVNVGAGTKPASTCQ